MLLECLTLTLSLFICLILFFIFLLKNQIKLHPKDTVYENNILVEYSYLSKLTTQIKELIKELTINNKEINSNLLINKLIKKEYFNCLSTEAVKLVLYELINSKESDVLVSLFVRGVNDKSSIILKMPPTLIYQKDIQSSLDVYLSKEDIKLSSHGLSSLFLILFLENTPLVSEIDFSKEENLIIKKYNLFNYFFYKICIFKNKESLFLQLHELKGKEDYRVSFVIYNKFINKLA